MSSARGRRLKSFLERFQTAPKASSQAMPEEASVEHVEMTHPVEAYYRHKAQNNLRVLYRFAIQSRSLLIRDVLAKASSSRNLQLPDLLAVIDNNPLQDLSNAARERFAAWFDSSILLALADLLANTARDDLDTHAAVKIYDFVRQMDGDDSFSDQQALLYVEALNDAGLYERSDLLAKKYSVNDIAPLQRELLNLQRVRYTGASIKEWVNTLNELYSTLGLTQVRVLEHASLPYMDRLASNGEQHMDGPRVSVIMPTFAPGPGIRTAIRSLLEQTWRNLEIIIVDDASPNEYRPIFDELAQLDSRIRVLHQDTNLGAYVARNRGLAVATGEFITTADDDDWSHPDKIATQVSVMLAEPSVVATTSGHIRTTENLELRRLNSSAKFLQMNYSSLMFRRQIVDEVGGWDTVNRGADSEFYTRVTEYYGSNRVVRLLDKPLAFSRVRAGSLTSGEMYRGFIGTPRVLYLWAIRQWRWDLGKVGQKPRRVSNTTRPYAVASNLEAGQRKRDFGKFDVIYATDFFRHAKHVDLVVNELETLSEAGFRVGYLHLYSPETTRPEGFPRRLFELQLDNKITQLSHDDTAETDLLIVYGPAVGMFTDQLQSTIKSRRSIIIDHRFPTLSGAEERDSYLLSQVLQNLDYSFNTEFRVVSSTIDDQRLLREVVPSHRVLQNDLVWNPHLRSTPGQIRSPKSVPVVGFHSYGNRYRWPSNTRDFYKIYISSEYVTAIYAHGELLRQKFGDDVLGSIQIVSADDMSEGDFLRRIDFWVYYPNERLLDRIWEPVLKAMHAGKVVILPERLRSIYGSGAVYASKDRVSETVLKFSKNPDAFIEQAKQGQAFVEKAFTSSELTRRINVLIRE